MSSASPKVVSLYAGAGGLDVGFKQAGFNTVLATDNWEPACKTLEINKISPTVICADIRAIDFLDVKSKIDIRNIDCVIGGPPCPAYSKSRFYLKDKKRALEDENSFTLEEYFRAVEQLRPKVFLFENVFGFVYKPHRNAFDYLKKRADMLGYTISHQVINCADFGVPQIRERFFCVGVKKGLPPYVFPPKSHGKHHNQLKDVKPWVTAGDVLNEIDYPRDDDASMMAGSKHKELLKLIPPGDNYLYLTAKRGYPTPYFEWRSRYWSFLLKLSPSLPSWTIQASHSNNMGPFHWNNRFLRIEEIKRLQSFPDSYEIYGNYRVQWRQIGNAVPPQIAYVLASSILKQYF